MEAFHALPMNETNSGSYKAGMRSAWSQYSFDKILCAVRKGQQDLNCSVFQVVAILIQAACDDLSAVEKATFVHHARFLHTGNLWRSAIGRLRHASP